jgi:hypothetical protein
MKTLAYRLEEQLGKKAQLLDPASAVNVAEKAVPRSPFFFRGWAGAPVSTRKQQTARRDTILNQLLRAEDEEEMVRIVNEAREMTGGSPRWKRLVHRREPTRDLVAKALGK